MPIDEMFLAAIRAEAACPMKPFKSRWAGKSGNRGILRVLLADRDALAAEVERLRAHEADAKLGAAVRGMPSLAGMNRELVTLVYSSGDNRWFIVTRPGFVWHQMAVVSDELHRTPDAALVAAGLMEVDDAERI